MITKPKILLIDADARHVQQLREFFSKHDVTLNSIEEFRNTRFLECSNSPHLIVIDIVAPRMDGIDIVRAIREKSRIPILLATPKAGVEDRIRGLEAGADDYLVKPFEPRELLARIKSILRRWATDEVVESSSQSIWHFESLTIQVARRQAKLDGKIIELTTAEFDLLRLFVTNAQKIVSREDILEHLRGIEWDSLNRSADILVSRLRHKLGDNPRQPRFIRTIRNSGYQFIGEPSKN